MRSMQAAEASLFAPQLKKNIPTPILASGGPAVTVGQS
jgi:hypothetical protein